LKCIHVNKVTPSECGGCLCQICNFSLYIYIHIHSYDLTSELSEQHYIWTFKKTTVNLPYLYLRSENTEAGQNSSFPSSDTGSSTHHQPTNDISGNDSSGSGRNSGSMVISLHRF